MPTFSNTRPTLPEAELPLIKELPGDLSRMAGIITGFINNDLVSVRIIEALSREFRGVNVYFPSLDKLMRNSRDRRIREDFDAGTTGHQLAMKYSLSERRIWEILGQAE
jgi:Mor family transcriptional regulator